MEPSAGSDLLPRAVLSDGCHLQIPSRPDWIGLTVDHLIERTRLNGSLDAARANRVMLALHEALTNAVVHGNLAVPSALKQRGDDAFTAAVAARCADPRHAERVVDIRATYDGFTLRWVVTDQGDGFDVATVLGRLDAEGPDPTLPSGRGLMLIRAFTDSMRFEEGGRRLVLAVRCGRIDERRGEPRMPVHRPVQVTPLDDAGQAQPEESRPAVAFNVSRGGIAFLHPDQEPPSRVLLTIQAGEEAVAMPAEVRHWRPVGDNVIEVGCRFESPPLTPSPGAASPDAGTPALAEFVQRLLDEQTPAVERRAAARALYTERIDCAIAGAPVQQGYARNLSREGIAFFSTVALPTEEVQLRLPTPSGGVIQIRGQVVRCTRLLDGLFDVGVAFVR